MEKKQKADYNVIVMGLALPGMFSIFGVIGFVLGFYNVISWAWSVAVGLVLTFLLQVCMQFFILYMVSRGRVKIVVER